MIPYKSKLTKRSIKGRNEQFLELSTEDQKREIALDNLHLITFEHIRPAGGITKRGLRYDKGYWVTKKLKNLQAISDDPKQLQERLNEELPPTCIVCQRGGLMLSKIRLADGVDPQAGTVDRGNKSTAAPFTSKELIHMESAYEKWGLSEKNRFQGGHNMYKRYKIPYPPNTLENMANNLCVIIDRGKFDINYAKVDYIAKWSVKVPKI